MGRILAVDYGRKRTGLAVTDSMQIIANGLCTVSSNDVVKFLTEYTSKETVDLFVVGLPKQMNNEDSENMKYVKAFTTHLERTLPNIPIAFYDERFTSVLAHKAMLEGGLKKKKRQDKALVDEISAVIILQSYLESKKYQNSL
jgi:RNAse H-fold protein YqgF